jgi:hypothetical protein
MKKERYAEERRGREQKERERRRNYIIIRV